MSDFASSLPIRTENNGDVVSKLCDGTTTTQLLSIDANGKIVVKLNDDAGNGVTSQANGLQRALDVGINVAGIQIDPRSIRALTSSDVVSVVQSTSPWVTKDQSDGPVAPGTVAAFSSLAGGQYNSTLPSLTTTQQSALQLDANGRLIVVSSNFPTTLDTDYGTVGANTLRVASQIGNAGGAADFGAGATGAQTLRTVANQGAPNTTANSWPIKVTDGTNVATVKAASTAAAAGDTSIVVALSPNSPVPAGTNLIGSVNSRTQDGSGTAITSGVQGLKQALDVEMNANGAVVSTANPLPVFVSNTVPGTEILDYQTSAAVAANASVTHSYTVTALKTLTLQQISASGSGKIKVEIKIAGATKVVKFNSTAQPNVDHNFFTPQQVAAGVVVAVTVTNLDKSAQDIYTTREGVEV
jgi:hypothetical protein